jgi:hypothetical protein
MSDGRSAFRSSVEPEERQRPANHGEAYPLYFVASRHADGYHRTTLLIT